MLLVVCCKMGRGIIVEMFVTLKKLGGFYSAYNEDAYILFYLFHYNIKNNKAGFPLSAYNKVINCLEENNINYIVDGKDNEKRDFKKKNRYQFIVEKGKKLYEREQRANTLYTEISNLKESEVDGLLTLIENYVFER